MNKTIAVIKGDGIGPEIVEAAERVLKKIEHLYGHTFILKEFLAGGIAIDRTGVCLPEATIEGCKNADAVVLGAVGGPKWDAIPLNNRPEKALLELRRHLGVYANVRPSKIYSPLKGSSPLKNRIIEKGIDVCIVRELTGGIYFGHKTSDPYGEYAGDEMKYSKKEIERIAKMAFEMARKRHRKVTSVDKSNVLSVSRLWRRVVNEVAESYPEVKLEHMYVDNAAMQLISNPSQFDVILTSNMFGDILSDEMSMISGTLGVLPSASLSERGPGLFEPIHGSAPDIANQGVANPIGTISSIGMMLKYSFNMTEESEAIEKAIQCFFEAGYRTRDLFIEGQDQKTHLLSTEEVAEKICDYIS